MTELGDVLGERYRLERLIGRGGMSDVYEAYDLVADGPVAIKLVRSGDPDFAQRLEREIQALESLEHPGLIRLLDSGQFDDQAYLVMDYVDGPTLASTLRSGRLASPVVATMGAQLAATLAYVHAQGVVHRDVKPSNILLASDGTARLGDFGVALLHDATTITAVGSTLGTVTYMAPEQFEGSVVGAPADVWSLGVVLLESLTGRRVFEGAPSEIVARRLRGPVKLDNHLPVPWKMLLTAMLDERPANRPESRDVEALLLTPAFSAPWEPVERPSANDVSAHDETLVFDAATAIVPIGGLGVLDADATTRRPVTKPAVDVRRSYERPRWLVPALVALALAVVVSVVLAAALSSSPPTTTTTTSTSTTLASPSRALAALTQAIASSEAAQSLNAATGQSVAVDAQQALVDASAGNVAAVESQLQQAQSTLANAATLGQVTPSAATTLERDVAQLAASLGVPAPVATTTTSTTAPSGPPAFPGHGHGHSKH